MKTNKRSINITVNLLIIAIAGLTLFALTIPNAASSLTVGAFPVYRGTEPNSVSFRCDVDWNASAVRAIADTLKAEGAAMTFAVTGEWARDNAELLRGLVSYGNEAAVLFTDGSSVESAVISIESVTGVRPRLIMTDGGMSRTARKEASRLGLTVVRCTVDLDTANGSAGEIVNRLGGSLSCGSVIRVSPTAAFAEALPYLIEIIKNMGLDIVPIHKMLYN